MDDEMGWIELLLHIVGFKEWFFSLIWPKTLFLLKKEEGKLQKSREMRVDMNALP